MKIIKITSLIMVGALALASCVGNTSESTGTDVDMPKAQVDSVSYAVGAALGNMVKQGNFGPLNMAELDKAFDEVLSGKKNEDLKISPEQAGMVIQQYMMARTEKLSEQNKQEAIDFIAENKLKEGVDTTASGLQYKIIEPGSAVLPVPTDTVKVNYQGTLLNGKEFDASPKGEPVEFVLNRVIPGWTEGLQLIGEGGKVILYIPSDLAYGAQGGGGGAIGPNAMLIFEVELLEVSSPKK